MSAENAIDILKVIIYRNKMLMIFFQTLKGEVMGGFLVRSEAGAEILSVKTRLRVEHWRVVRKTFVITVINTAFSEMRWFSLVQSDLTSPAPQKM